MKRQEGVKVRQGSLLGGREGPGTLGGKGLRGKDQRKFGVTPPGERKKETKRLWLKEEMRLPVGRNLGKILHPKLILFPATLTHDTETLGGPAIQGGTKDGGSRAIPLSQSY